MQFHFAFDTIATPEQVVAAFTDFTDRRLEIWKASLDPAKYELQELGDTWAIAREGSKSPSVWAVEHYDWSEPGTVRWAAQHSNFCKPGSGVELVITSRDNGGSHVEGDWHRTPVGIKRAFIVLMARAMLPKIIPTQWAHALDAYASE